MPKMLSLYKINECITVSQLAVAVVDSVEVILPVGRTTDGSKGNSWTHDVTRQRLSDIWEVIIE